MSHRLMIMGCVKMNVALIDLLRLIESVDVQKVCNRGEMVNAVMLLPLMVPVLNKCRG